MTLSTLHGDGEYSAKDGNSSQWHYFLSVQLFTYDVTYAADDIDIIKRTKRDVTADFSVIERESIMTVLPVQEGKSKYMLSTSIDVRLIDYVSDYGR